jgi:hypothetical protein
MKQVKRLQKIDPRS